MHIFNITRSKHGELAHYSCDKLNPKTRNHKIRLANGDALEMRHEGHLCRNETNCILLDLEIWRYLFLRRQCTEAKKEVMKGEKHKVKIINAKKNAYGIDNDHVCTVGYRVARIS